jgi:hypothetical protein
MNKDADILPTGEYFMNLYKDGETGLIHTDRDMAKAFTGPELYKRLRLKVTNIGDILDVFDVDQVN